MNQTIQDDIKLTANQMAVKYSSTGEHPVYTCDKYEMSGSDEDDYWRWVRDQIAEDFTQNGTVEEIKAAMLPEDAGLSADDLADKYHSTHEHPTHTEKMWIAAGSPGGMRGYWPWVVTQLPAEGDCQSCVEDKCVTGPECVATSNPVPAHPGIINGVRVDVADGKYSVIMNAEGGLQALRHGEPWVARDLTGDKFVHMLALELKEARDQLAAQDLQFEKSNDTIRQLLTALETLKKETPYPVETMTDAMKEVLSLPNFRCGPIAHVFVKAGFDIAPRSEDEQSFVLHRYLGYALKHGTNWKGVAEAELQRLGAPTYNKVAVEEKEIVAPPEQPKIILS